MLLVASIFVCLVAALLAGCGRFIGSCAAELGRVAEIRRQEARERAEAGLAPERSAVSDFLSDSEARRARGPLWD